MPIAVVTGSSSGIGRATAVTLAQRGYDVLLHGFRNLEGLQTTAKLIRQASPQRQIRLGTGDLANAGVCCDLVELAFSWQSQVDVWINLAGVDVLTGKRATASFEAKLEQLLEVDVMATIRLSRLALGRWKTGARAAHPKPSLVNIGWDQALTGMEGDAGQLFCPSKAAIHAFTRSLSIEAGSAVRVNLVAPGWIRTQWGKSVSPYWDKRAQAESLLGRWGTPEDVAHTIAWLCSPEAEFVNGQTIEVNGGCLPHQS